MEHAMSTTVHPSPAPRLHPPARDADGRAEPEATFDSAVRPQIGGMLRAARAILGSEDLAWDAVQETLLRVWQDGWLPAEPGPALRRLATLSALHIARCGRRRRAHEEARALQQPCCAEDPLAQVEGEELRAEVRGMLADLTRRYRGVLELHGLEGEDYASIARRLRVPVGTVRSRLSRARRELRLRLGRLEAASREELRESGNPARGGGIRPSGGGVRGGPPAGR
jgi:RNA polymerase sigma-70 factor (ECF subfamily)